MSEGNAKNFEAVLVPHRSLTRQGFVVLMAVIAGINFAAGMVFFLMGAWPVVGFMGLDVLLIWWALKANFASARRAERFEITPGELIVSRIERDVLREEVRFIRAWVRVELEEDHQRELIGRLFLRSHGKRTEIGSFISGEARQAFARELRAALAAA
ncbi:DUF2244 domain-containing protein [soil metagenome]